MIPVRLLPLARRIWLSWHRPRALARLRQSSLDAGRPHGLPRELVVSLTSYPPRFPCLQLTIQSLLAQSIKADRVILWIAYDDETQVPSAVRELEQFGLEIRMCEDLSSFKKLIPALKEFGNQYIVTTDDDIYYPEDWLEELVAGTSASPNVVVCHRAHRIVRNESGEIASYRDWEIDVDDEQSKKPSVDLMPTGSGGVLYPPGCLHPIVTDSQTFRRLCPDGDDLWFYWCARMAGTTHKKVGGRFAPITWAGSQKASLWQGNQLGGNDRMIRALEMEFGGNFGEGAAMGDRPQLRRPSRRKD